MSVSFEYEFKLEGGDDFHFSLEFDDTSFEFIPAVQKEALPEWTALAFNKCEHCPLSNDTHPNCPLAVNIATVSELFKDKISIEECNVVCQTNTRTYSKHVALQTGLHSILGIIMATSGCPNMSSLTPMARFHLPFASPEETMVRSLGFFLLSQFMAQQKQHIPTKEIKIDFDVYKRQFEAIRKVNKGILARIKSFSTQDASQNAIVILDGFADLLTMEIEDNFELISPFFAQS